MQGKKISWQGLRIWAKHGVLPAEKVNLQPFVFDGEMTVAFGDSDELDKTVNYAEVMGAIDRFVRENSFDLIETLCLRTARHIVLSFPLVQSILLTVKKPQAPVPLDFDFVSVTAEVRAEEAYLSIGANLGNRKENLDRAIEELKADENIAVEAVAPYLETAPYGGVATEPFLNSAVKIRTVYTPRELLDALHGIENRGGRVRKERWGNRTVDLDIVFFGQTEINDPDLIIPHKDFCNRDFVLTPLHSIAPDFVSPREKKTVAQLLEILKNHE